MLSFLLQQIWIRIDYFLLNFIATFGSVLGLQVTAGLRVNSELQPPTRWEPFAAGTMLRRPEPTKETIEPMILSIIAIAIPHSTRFNVLLLLRIQRYMWRNHVTTWALANNSGRKLDLKKILFPYLHYILQYSFWIEFESEKVESLYWYLENTQGTV